MSPQAGFLLQDQIRPRLISAIPNAVPFIAPEDAQEVIADGTAMAAQMIHQAEQKGKQLVQSVNGKRRKLQITCGNVAFYTIVKLRNGRRSTGSSVTDVHGVGTQIQGNTRLASLDEVAAVDELNGGEIYEFHDVLAADQEDPAVRAARKMDWHTFMSSLSKREQAIINCMIEGRTFREAAKSAKCSDAAIRETRRELANKVLDFKGLQILSDIQRRPQWKDSLNATHERLACREEHRTL